MFMKWETGRMRPTLELEMAGNAVGCASRETNNAGTDKSITNTITNSDLPNL